MLAKKTVEKYNKLRSDLGLDDFVFLYQIGIFYNIIGDDAEKLSSITGLKLSNNDCCYHIGFPVIALAKYVGQLLLNGYSFAVFGKKEKYSNEEGLIMKVNVENKDGSRDCRAVV